MLPRIVVPPAVYSHLLSGADVMLPGVLHGSDLQGATIGDARAVYVAGNDAAIGAPDPLAVLLTASNASCSAVGTILLDDRGIQAAAGRGKCLRTCHVYGDGLWRHGDRSVPNDGFVSDAVAPLTTAVEEEPDIVEAFNDMLLDVDDTVAPDEPEAETVDMIEDMKSALEAAARHALTGLDNGSLPVSLADIQQLILDRDDRLDVKQTPYRTWDMLFKAFARRGLMKCKDVRGEPSIVSINHQHQDLKTTVDDEPEDVDNGDDAGELENAIDEALLRALATRVTAGDLPLTASALTEHMRACWTGAGDLQIKSSRYKTFPKLFKAFAKRGLIKVKDQKSSLAITSVNASHPDIVRFTASSSQEANAAPARRQQRRDDLSKIRVVTMFEPTKRIRFLFGAAPSRNLVTMGDARGRLMRYLDEEGLRDDGGQARLNPVLADALWHGVADAECPSVVPMKTLFEHFERQLTMHTAIDLGDGVQPKFKKGQPPTIEVLVERAGSNRLRTRVKNLEPFGIDPGDMARSGQKLFATSTTVKPVAGKASPAASEVLIQGRVDKEVCAYLKDVLRVPANLVTVVRKDVKS